MPIDRYIVYLLSVDARLVVEIDGGQHDAERDVQRTRTIEACGYLVIRFWNNDVLMNMDGVLVRILQALRAAAPHPTPLPDGEREQERR